MNSAALNVLENGAKPFFLGYELEDRILGYSKLLTSGDNAKIVSKVFALTHTPTTSFSVLVSLKL